MWAEDIRRRYRNRVHVKMVTQAAIAAAIERALEALNVTVAPRGGRPSNYDEFVTLA